MGCLWHCFNHLLSAIYSWTSLSHSVPDSLPSSKNDLTGSAGTATPSHGWFIQSLGLPHDLKNNHNNNHHHHDISMYCVVPYLCVCVFIYSPDICHSLAPSLPGPRTNTWSRPGRCSASPDKRIFSGDSYAPISFGDIHDMPIYNAVIYIYIFIYLVTVFIYNQETCEISGIRGQWLQGTCSHDVRGELQWVSWWFAKRWAWFWRFSALIGLVSVRFCRNPWVFCYIPWLLFWLQTSPFPSKFPTSKGTRWVPSIGKV